MQCAWTEGETLLSIVDQDVQSVIFSQYCIQLLRKPVRTDLLLCDGNIQLNHAPAAKTSYINKTKYSHCLVTDRTLI